MGKANLARSMRSLGGGAPTSLELMRLASDPVREEGEERYQSGSAAKPAANNKEAQWTPEAQSER